MATTAGNPRELTLRSVILGVLLGGEHVTGWAFVALPVILVGIGVVMYAQNARAPRST